jgi:hypothetical protein
MDAIRLTERDVTLNELIIDLRQLQLPNSCLRTFELQNDVILNIIDDLGIR